TLEGPSAPPGTYHVRLKIGNETSEVATASFQISQDPGIEATQESLQARFALLLAIRNKLSETHESINTIRDIRRQTEEWEQRTKGQSIHKSIASTGKQLREKLTAIEEQLFQTKAKKQVDVMDYPMRLAAKIATLTEVVASADAPPTQQAQEVFADLSARIDAQLQQLRELIKTDVAAFNKLISDASVPAIIPLTPHPDGSNSSAATTES
ncbi:MAG TPA: hypothetical protein VGN15_10125, partial [Ktedonobacteraceae bacterium]|nr:hypothetical protein [Ktedonobacteraceae bacterium]